jgi:hypothetical protein
LPTETEQELEVTAHGFLASPLTENIRQMDDGSLVIESCPIARTGWQTYQVRDLPQQAARDLGIDLRDPNAEIDLYRPPEEVFHPEFVASLEGRSISDNHPPEWITPANFNTYAKGHFQNVRKGDAALDDGEWPLVADLVISGEPVVAKVLDKRARELSLGYDYSIRREGDKIVQCGMVGNHLAVVPKGRAGDDVRINDSADGSTAPAPEESPPTRAAPPGPAAPLPPEPGVGPAALDNHAAQPKKEKPKVKNNLLHIFGLGLRAKAADAETTPEELAEMAADVGKVKDEAGIETTMSRDKGKRGKDAPVIDPVDEDHEEPADDKRKAAHDALDRMLDARSKDTDIAELRKLLDEYLGEEQEEPEHVTEDADPAELEALLGAGEQPDAEDEVQADPGEELQPSGEESLEEADDMEGEGECAHCGTAHDLENCPSCGCKDRKAKATDRARAADSVKAVLKMFRPFVARSNDSGMRSAFNTALSVATRSSRVRPSGARSGYGEFASSARVRDSKVGVDPNPQRRAAARDAVDPVKKLNDYYEQRRVAGGK